MPRLALTRAALLLLLALVAAPAPAQQLEPEALRHRLDELHARIAQLQEQGKHDEARALAEKAQALAARLHAAAPQGDEPQPGKRREPTQEPRDLERILDGLERGMESLKLLGRDDALEMLGRVADDVRRQREEARRRSREQQQRREENPELRAAREQLEVFRIAREGLEAAGRADAAERMLAAIRAGELRLEGVGGERAEQAQRREPDHAQTTELLALAAQQLREQGKPDRAGVVARLAEQFGERYRRKPRDGATNDDVRQQIEQLRREVEELRRALQEQRRGR